MKLRASLPSLAAVVVAFLMSSAHDAQAKLAGRNVKIGCMVSLTGKGVEWGQAAKLSMEIAVDEINAKGGIGGVPIDLICFDTQTLEAEALKIVSRLVERDKVLAISGPCFSSEFETIAPQLERLKTVINSYCSAKPGLSDMSIWAFRNTLTSDKQLKPVVDAWLKEYKIKKVVIIYDAEDAVSKGEGVGVLPALFKAHGVEVLDSLSYRTKDTDYSAQVTKAKALGAEGVGLGACYQNAGAIAKEMAKQGFNVPIVGGACAGAPGFIEIAGKAAEGAYMSTAAWLEDPRPEVQAYVKKILAKNNNHPPPYSGPRAYDIIYAYKHCIETSGVTNNPSDLDADRDRIRGCLAGLKHFPGVAGEITMDEHRDGAGSSAILKVVNGKYVNVAK
ncbi:MAG TPA: ABC transporter substrate-binding protein [Xanthobacteraceae bacterium]|jgi:branched-chain amino acid transport system substrate-binding protein